MKPDYQRGPVTLYCGDFAEVLPTLADASADAVVTDPPFGIGFTYESHEDNPATYAQLITTLRDEANRCVKDGGLVFVWQAMKNAALWSEWFTDDWRVFAGLKNFTQHRPVPVQYSWDPIIFWSRGKCPRRAPAGCRDYHIGNTAKWIGQQSSGHPCPRPLDTVEYIVRLATDKGDVVLDPCIGSGTTAIAAIHHGCSCIGVEIDPKYFDIAVRRIDAELRQGRFDFEEPANGIDQ